MKSQFTKHHTHTRLYTGIRNVKITGENTNINVTYILDYIFMLCRIGLKSL